MNVSPSSPLAAFNSGLSNITATRYKPDGLYNAKQIRSGGLLSTVLTGLPTLKQV